MEQIGTYVQAWGSSYEIVEFDGFEFSSTPVLSSDRIAWIYYYDNWCTVTFMERHANHECGGTRSVTIQ